ncbi:DUF1173 family protein [Nonomuraea sp. KM90]|uniref:DUF1173 family protein n=1 Tax=Nonomuraea sp. KM90 TaxID=3457428 RepID=UPI003FCD11FB
MNVPEARSRRAVEPEAFGAQLVELAGHRVELAALRRAPERFSRLFGAAKSQVGHAWCLCGEPPLRLVVRARDGRYHLAGWPGEGHRHAAGCDFHKLVHLSGRGIYAAGAIEQTDEGDTHVRLEIPLQVSPGRAPGGRTRTPGTEENAALSSRPSVGLLGMLHLLWQDAGLSEWLLTVGRRRTWHDCHHALHRPAATCFVNSVSLAAVLYVVPPYRPATVAATARAFERFRAALGTHDGIIQRGLILGEIKEVAPTSYGYRIALRHQRDPIFLDAPLWERVRRSYRSPFAKSLPHGARRIVLAVIERAPRGYLRAIDLAAMMTNSHYVPADSSHEVRMADHLIRAGRAFIKPLRYEAGDAVFPDFILMDVEPWVCVEVFGVQGMQAYEQRKRAKRAYYADTGTPVLEWDVTDPLPDLPG